MTTNHTELCEKLRYEAKAIMSSFASEDHLFAHFFEAADLIEQQAARIQQQALEYVSLQAQCDEHLGRIAELEADRDCWRDQASQRLADWDAMRKERDALKVDAERYEYLLDCEVESARRYLPSLDADEFKNARRARHSAALQAEKGRKS